jgi:hypothetical protein
VALLYYFACGELEPFIPAVINSAAAEEPKTLLAN